MISAPLRSLIFCWAIVGYPVAVLAAEATGLGGLSYAVFLRVLVIVFVGLVLVTQRQVIQRFDVALPLFLLFWALYVSRLVLDTGFYSSKLGQNAIYYWQWAIGVCFLPAVIFWMNGKTLHSHSIVKLLKYVLPIALLLALQVSDTVAVSQAGALVETGRIQLERLNPITLGHLCSVSILVFISVLRNRSSLASRILSFASIILATYLLLKTGSRGPLISLTVSLIIFGGINFFATSSSKVRMAIVGIGLLLSSSLALAYSNGILFRLDATNLGMSASIRISLMTFAWEQFLSQPIFGSGLVEQVSRFYPHNLVIESFMATGIIGGVVFLMLCLLSLKRACLLLPNPSFAIFGLFFIYYATSGMFSGAIYSVSAFWISLVAVNVLSVSKMAVIRKGKLDTLKSLNRRVM